MTRGPAGRLALPAGFTFGVGTTAAQVEGGSLDEGRTPSIWDVFAGVPGRIVDGSSPAVAVDHYHRWAGDLDLIKALGVTAYHFTVSWSRLQPTGRGPASGRGVAFYDRLLDRLLENGIAPFVGLHHADLPLELMEEGGWLLRSTADAFADYAALAASALGDRVAAWSTVDEPLTHMAYGYAIGIDAPGLTLLGGAFQASHHQLLAHGMACRVLRSEVSGAVGIVNDHTAVRPARRTVADRRAAGFYDTYHNRQFADPVLLGRYPRAILEMPGAAIDVIKDDDLRLIAAPLDFYGVSYSHPITVSAAPDNSRIPFTLEVPPAARPTDAGWPDEPAALTEVLTDLTRRYPKVPPMSVIGAGAAFADRRNGDATGGHATDSPANSHATSDGATSQGATDHDAAGDGVDAAAGTAGAGGPAPDRDRIGWIDGAVAAVAAAADQGSVVTGYFHRSLLDSWEWTEGFTRSFGLVGVDRETLERRPRASFDHYRRLIAQPREVPSGNG